MTDLDQTFLYISRPKTLIQAYLVKRVRLRPMKSILDIPDQSIYLNITKLFITIILCFSEKK